MDREMQNLQGTSENSSSSVDSVVLETIVMARSAESETVRGGDQVSEAKIDISETSRKVSIEERKLNVPEPENHSCVIDVKCNTATLDQEYKDGEKVCRICHLSDDHQSKTPDLIQLGCRCKESLGVAHRHCAETWFKLKGNRCCEICGEVAKNITGDWDNGFMEGWNERRMDGNGDDYSDRRRRICRGQLFCNFLMACLVIAFVLPWFFRINMF